METVTQEGEQEEDRTFFVLNTEPRGHSEAESGRLVHWQRLATHAGSGPLPRLGGSERIRSPDPEMPRRKGDHPPTRVTEQNATRAGVQRPLSVLHLQST